MCRVAGLWCALPIEHVVETMRPLPIEQVSGAPEYVLGVSIVRGRPIPVLDARRLLGSVESARPGRFVTLSLGSRAAALAVDETSDVRSLAGTDLLPLSPLLGLVAAQTIASIAQLDRALLLVLDATRLVPEGAWVDDASAPT